VGGRRRLGRGGSGARGGVERGVSARFLSSRFARLPSATVLGARVPVADTFRSRLLGLALLPRARAPAGLLVPRCRSVHTFGMRFPIDVVFLDPEGRELERIEALPPRRLAARRGAASVLELPAAAQSRPWRVA